MSKVMITLLILASLGCLVTSALLLVGGKGK